MNIDRLVIRPVLSYSVETRNETIKTRGQIELSGMILLRRIARKRRQRGEGECE